jgi:hypothetical protein
MIPGPYIAKTRPKRALRSNQCTSPSALSGKNACSRGGVVVPLRLQMEVVRVAIARSDHCVEIEHALYVRW